MISDKKEVKTSFFCASFFPGGEKECINENKKNRYTKITSKEKVAAAAKDFDKDEKGVSEKEEAVK